MRKSVIALLTFFTITAQAPQRAQAGAFATEVTQLLNHAELILLYIQQGVQLENEISMLANMLRNTKNLSSQTFGAIQSDINALAQIVQGGQALAYSLGNLDQMFRSTYPATRRIQTFITRITSNGRKPRSIPRSERSAPPGCKISRCRANIP